MKRKYLNTYITFALMITMCIILNCAIAQAAIKKPGKTGLEKIVSTEAGKMTVMWKKAPKAGKYQVQTALDKKFTNDKKSKTVSAKKQKCIFTKLQAGKKYYARVRAYRVVSGKKYYGKWSTIKSITTKSVPAAKQLPEDDFEIYNNNTYYYTGQEIKPEVISMSLIEGKDYKVTYSDNVEIGTAMITITGIGDYNGSIVKYFNICKVPQKIKATVENTTMEVGESQKINVSGTYGEVKYETSSEGVVSVSKDGIINALKAGYTTVYLNADGDDTHQAYERYLVARITVKEKEKATQVIKVTKEESKMTVGSTQKINVSGAYGDLKWHFSEDGIVSISDDGTLTALKEGTTNIHLSASGDDTHKAYDMYYVGKIVVVKKPKVYQNVTAELESEYLHIGKSQKINVSGAYGEVTFEPWTEGIVSISPDGTMTGLKSGWTKIYLNATGDEEHYPITDQYIGGIVVVHEEATACGFDSSSVSGPYKKQSYKDGRKENGTATFSVKFFCNSDEEWLDGHITFEAQDVTANAYKKMFNDMGVEQTEPKITTKTMTIVNWNLHDTRKTVNLPYTKNGPAPCNELAIVGKEITVDAGASTRVVKLIAKKDGEMVDYIYLGTTSTSMESAVYDKKLYKMVRERIESQLWTDDMSNLEKLAKMASYIRLTTHYPDSQTTNPYLNPTFWEDWSVDDQILEYWMFEDVTLSAIMVFQGGIVHCYAAQNLNHAAQQDLGLPYLYDGNAIADGEGVWLALGSESSNPTNPSHMSLMYKDAEENKCYIDAEGQTGSKGITCEEHDCRSKILPLQ